MPDHLFQINDIRCFDDESRRREQLHQNDVDAFRRIRKFFVRIIAEVKRVMIFVFVVRDFIVVTDQLKQLFTSFLRSIRVRN